MTKESIAYLFLSQFLATISGVLVVLIVNYINKKFYEPKSELKSLISEVSYILINEARYYNNPIRTGAKGSYMDTVYYQSAQEMRKISSKLKTFACSHDKEISGYKMKDLFDAGEILSLVSQNYFIESNKVDTYNKIERVKKLLKIENETKEVIDD